MIYSLTGKCMLKEPGVAVIECGGVGYRCVVSLATLQTMPPLGAPTTLLTHLQVREDGLELFGFGDRAELDCFRLLIAVSGVGPKAAMSILSSIPPQRLSLLVSAGDSKAIKAPGVGPKIAQRIILELRDKLGIFTDGESGHSPTSSATDGTPAGEAVSALISLGYTPSEAAQAVAKQDASLAVEELVKGGLKLLMRM